MPMDSEENENSISEDASIAGTSTNLLQQKRKKAKIKPNWSCRVNVSVNKICYLSYIYRI